MLRLPVVFYFGRDVHFPQFGESSILSITYSSYGCGSVSFCIPDYFSTVPIMSILALRPVPTVLGWTRFGVKELYGSADVPSWPLC